MRHQRSLISIIIIFFDSSLLLLLLLLHRDDGHGNVRLDNNAQLLITCSVWTVTCVHLPFHNSMGLWNFDRFVYSYQIAILASFAFDRFDETQFACDTISRCIHTTTKHVQSFTCTSPYVSNRLNEFRATSMGRKCHIISLRATAAIIIINSEFFRSVWNEK